MARTKKKTKAGTTRRNTARGAKKAPKGPRSPSPVSAKPSRVPRPAVRLRPPVPWTSSRSLVSRGLALALTIGCTPAAPPTGSDPASPPPAEEKLEDPVPPGDPVPPEDPVQSSGSEEITLRATVDIDDKPGGKKFQGVWLVTEDGNRHVISYRADPWWLDFEGRTVDATGTPYQPRGQAIGADHFRVEEMRVVKPTTADPLVMITNERELEGEFTRYEWPKKAKLEGTTTLVFEASDGQRYFLSEVPDPEPPVDERLKIKGRIVEPSPFVARPGGPYLWVVDVNP